MTKTSTILVIIIVLILLAGGIFFVSQNQNSIPTNATSTPAYPAGSNSANYSGNTVQTNTVTTQTVAGAPVVITGLTAFPSDTAATITGLVTPNGAFTNYWFEFGTSVNLGNKTSTQSVGSGFTPIPTPALITGLKTNTTYYFRLVASNQYGQVSGTQYSFQTTQGNPPPTGSAPTVKTATASEVSTTKATLNGLVNPNKGTTQYWFEYGTSTSLGNVSAFTSAGNGSVNESVNLSLADLISSTRYYFRLDAQNQFGTINGTILNFKTK
ncbi:MAG: hypothetical protein PHF79_02725 [Candidatus Pacebacteria bacterium]|nr:hypothetical protein [Candidatus Paceibacterota bacterium]